MKTSIIICTYNEAGTIFNVVAACCKHNPGAEVIVVDDGSTDETEAILETLSLHHKFAYLKLENNTGQSNAMAHGVEYASGDVILLFNADVTQLRKEHFDAMLEPICQGNADLVIGAASGTTIDYKSSPYKSLIGQKAMLREDLLPLLNDIREIRFNVENYILLHYQTSGKRIHFSILEGLKSEVKASETELYQDDLFVEEDNVEVANALLLNIDLITKRVQNNVQKTQNYTRSTITSVQLDLNQRMKRIKERMSELQLV